MQKGTKRNLTDKITDQGDSSMPVEDSGRSTPPPPVSPAYGDPGSPEKNSPRPSPKKPRQTRRLGVTGANGGLGWREEGSGSMTGRDVAVPLFSPDISGASNAPKETTKEEFVKKPTDRNTIIALYNKISSLLEAHPIQTLFFICAQINESGIRANIKLKEASSDEKFYSLNKQSLYKIYNDIIRSMLQVLPNSAIDDFSDGAACELKEYFHILIRHLHTFFGVFNSSNDCSASVEFEFSFYDLTGEVNRADGSLKYPFKDHKAYFNIFKSAYTRITGLRYEDGSSASPSAPVSEWYHQRLTEDCWRCILNEIPEDMPNFADFKSMVIKKFEDMKNYMHNITSGGKGGIREGCNGYFSCPTAGMLSQEVNSSDSEQAQNLSAPAKQ